MKRVKAACICQTLHFLLKEDIPREVAVKLVRQEVEQYKKGWSATAPSTASWRRASNPTGPSL